MNLFVTAVLSFLLSASIITISSPFPQGVLGLKEAAPLPIEAGVPYYLVPLNYANISQGGITLISTDGEPCPIHVGLGGYDESIPIVFSPIDKSNVSSHNNITEDEDVSIHIYNGIPDCANTSLWHYYNFQPFLPPTFVRINGGNIGKFGTRFKVKRVFPDDDDIKIFKLQGYRRVGDLQLLRPINVGVYKDILFLLTGDHPLWFTLVSANNTTAGYKSAM
ncbi:hypothetical protein Tsubulata_048009 [Turnera subulata]|uniref:Uncharacterized protein n=1 Tax=Turnera subulata TaxID=218843 RepID=A0A9Q0FTK6_9ROSI|nr:hypothetical protein Tsubulata_048009 [Turnera subulata]